MNFWDRFVRAIVLGLAVEPIDGHGAARRIVGRAFTRRRLTPAALDETSLLLLLALLAETSPHLAAVRAEALARQLHLEAGAPQLLRAAAQPRIEELIELGRAPGPQFRNLVVTSLWELGDCGVIERVCLYLGRLWHGDPDGRPLRVITRGLVAEATRLFAAVPPGTYDFLGYLFCRVRARTQAPDTPFHIILGPHGHRPQEPDELRFVEACMLDLIEPAVDVLYLHLYAGLTVGQIIQSLRLFHHHGAREAIVRRLEESWEIVL
jgi:hypothetical protein